MYCTNAKYATLDNGTYAWQEDASCCCHGKSAVHELCLLEPPQPFLLLTKLQGVKAAKQKGTKFATARPGSGPREGYAQ